MPSLPPATLKARVITQIIAFVAFVLLPILITLMVPFTKLEFSHAPAGATATATRYALIAIPWRNMRIENVTQVIAEITPEKRYRGTLEERRKGQKGVRHATGQLVIVHDGPDVIVQAEPELAREIAAQFDRFAVDKRSEPMVFSVYASWWLSYVLGGVMTGLFALYAVGVVLAVFSVPVNLMRRRAKA
jgi:hypothetical protein